MVYCPEAKVIVGIYMESGHRAMTQAVSFVYWTLCMKGTPSAMQEFLSIFNF